MDSVVLDDNKNPEQSKQKQKDEKGLKYPDVVIGSQSIASIILVAIITVMVNYLAARHYKRFDWTAGKYYTLSQKTINVLRSLNDNIEIVAFLSVQSNIYNDIREILSRYKSYSPKLSIEYVDPDIDSARFELLQKKYGIRSGTLPDGREISEQVIVVARGDRVKFITPGDITEYEFDENPYASAPSLKKFKAEQELTSAILSVTEKEAVHICFITGHGEWDVKKFDQRGIGHIEELLKRDNYKVDSFSLAEKPKIPSVCKLLVIAGPERPLTQKETAKIEQYLLEGGNLLAFIDPIIDGTKFVPSGLEKIILMAGIEAKQAIVVESDENRLLPISGVGMETFVTQDYGEHSITKPIEGIPVLFRVALPLKAAPGADVSPSEVLKTSEKSWGETDLEKAGSGEEPEKSDEDLPGPVILGFASEIKNFTSSGSKEETETKGQNEEKESAKNSEKSDTKGRAEAKGRVVVFGDSDILHRDLFSQLTLANQEIVLNSIAWLTERPDLISIPPKSPENIKLQLTESQMKTIFFWLFINLPLLTVIAGIVIWWKRRK